MKLSIIIPVYGVEKYIKKCVSSLLIPNCDQYEVILINDGTKDRSIDIVRENFSDERLRILEQENAGLSAARNFGIQESRGEYIWFIDSDDWIESQHILPIIEMLGDIDVLCFPYQFKNFEESRKEIVTGGELKGITGLEIACSDSSQCAPYYIWKKEALISNNLRFETGRLHEDALFTPTALLYMKRAKAFCQPVYHHRMREDSITHTINPKRICDLIYIIRQHIKTAETTVPTNVKYRWGVCIANLVNEVLYISQQCTDDQTIQTTKDFVNQNWDAIRHLKHARKRNTRCLGWLSTLFFGNLWGVYKILYKLRYRKTKTGL